MSIEVKVPVLPESVADATIATWHHKAGDRIRRDENLVDLETDKVVLEVPSPVDGVLKEIREDTGSTVLSQQVIAIIEEGDAPAADAPEKKSGDADKAGKSESTAKPSNARRESAAAASVDQGPDLSGLSPAARRVAASEGIDPAAVSGTGRDGQVTKEDLLRHASAPKSKPAPAREAAPAAKTAAPVPSRAPGSRTETRVPMSRIRTRIAERLMESKNSIAMLTSFNEINLREVVAMRKTQGEAFEKAHGVKLGFMSFFVKAVAGALERQPVVNAALEGTDIVYRDYADISIAVSTEKGLVTPVLRNAGSMSFAEIERAIGDYARAAREGGLKLEDLQGGTFTITNGGTFGSLFSTPIVNPPQSAILGMHTIKERAVVENGVVIAAPMMYVAISYDHRIIDGKDAVLFLVDIKNQLENPHRMLLGM